MAASVGRAITALILISGVYAEVKQPIDFDVTGLFSQYNNWKIPRSPTHSQDSSEWMFDKVQDNKPIQWIGETKNIWLPGDSEERNDVTWIDGLGKRILEADSDSEFNGDTSDDNSSTGIIDLNADIARSPSEKRSAVLAALNAGRRLRRGPQPPPTPALGILNNVENFFGSLRHNLESVASLSPIERALMQQEPPTAILAGSAGGFTGSGTGGYRRLHALRPLHPSHHIRSYDRRSFVESEEPEVRGANHHDPGLLWTGLGRRKR